ncbi:MAG: hypothetical protein IJ190_10465 [Prevotella sp.]|nr:hypothetical protein [Prevotella sp.]
MDGILAGQVIVNDKDIWTSYGVFLAEESEGGMDNLSAILTPSPTKEHTAVNIREQNGEKHSSTLTVANEARDVTLHFALYAPSKAEWFRRYIAFINFLKTGENGWLNISFPSISITMRVYYQSVQDKLKPLSYLWNEGMHAGRFKVKFREPNPII